MWVVWSICFSCPSVDSVGGTAFLFFLIWTNSGKEGVGGGGGGSQHSNLTAVPAVLSEYLSPVLMFCLIFLASRLAAADDFMPQSPLFGKPLSEQHVYLPYYEGQKMQMHTRKFFVVLHRHPNAASLGLFVVVVSWCIFRWFDCPVFLFGSQLYQDLWSLFLFNNRNWCSLEWSCCVCRGEFLGRFLFSIP